VDAVELTVWDLQVENPGAGEWLAPPSPSPRVLDGTVPRMLSLAHRALNARARELGEGHAVRAGTRARKPSARPRSFAKKSENFVFFFFLLVSYKARC
jgi:hypothetical protein